MDTFGTINILLLWGLGLLNLVLILAVVRKLDAVMKQRILGQPSELDLIDMGIPAPNFNAQSTTGKQMGLSDFPSDNLLLVFISPTCQPCREKLASLEQTAIIAKGNKTQLIFVSFGSMEATQAMADEFNLQSPVLIAPKSASTLQQDYKVPGTPFYVSIDDKRLIHERGYLDDEWDLKIQKWDQTLTIPA